HSLLGTRMISRMRDQFGVTVPLREIFAGPTVQALALKVSSLLRQKEEAEQEDLLRFIDQLDEKQAQSELQERAATGSTA
ncbi:MAG: phosphopantetheine-binding protein, partial [Acidobacteriota bacterium]|nr:phosphopantetheine-binding protein [Acidobacteriota bacterium]